MKYQMQSLSLSFGEFTQERAREDCVRRVTAIYSASGIISEIKTRKMDYNPILTSFIVVVVVAVVIACTLHVQSENK